MQNWSPDFIPKLTEDAVAGSSSTVSCPSRAARRCGMRASSRGRRAFSVGGELVGGCTDAFDAWRAGWLQRLLDANGVAYAKDAAADPYSFLPSWLHPR